MSFDERKRRSRRIVILQPSVWARIDGETQTASWEEAIALFPKPVEVTIQQQQMVVVDYEVWKATIRIFQQ